MKLFLVFILSLGLFAQENGTPDTTAPEIQRVNSYKIDKETPEVQKEIQKMIDKDFGILPYRANYLLPISYNKNSYKKTDASTPYSTEKYDSNTEVEFQLSLYKSIAYNIFGLNESLFLSYTQHSWWQLYTDSSPFRETNYSPEIFFSMPNRFEHRSLQNLKAINFGYRHESNGQDGYNSRSWNRIFLATFWQWENLFVKVEGWYRIPEERKGEEFETGANINADGDDNPDILRYYGYGDIQINYLYEEHQIGLKIRNNLRSKNKGALELGWTTPIVDSRNTYWYLRAFHGYGESLIDYNQENTKISFGFSFFRSLF